uniref:Uncharacterized protein n=1 Tax=Globodera rostochiensis TaxID=31243 RepID=A0A914H0S2_GLORO
MDYVLSWTDGLFKGMCSCGSEGTVAGQMKERRNSTSGTPRAIDRHHLQQNEQNHFDQNLRLFTLSATMKEGTTDFLSLLEKMQSQRMDDQRCEMPSGKGRNQANFLI